MTSRPRLRLERMDQTGEPGALVAAWLMGELLSGARVFGDVTVQLVQANEVILEVPSPEDLTQLHTRITALLVEPRFAQWGFGAG